MVLGHQSKLQGGAAMSIAEEFNERLEAFVQKYGLKNASGLLEVLTEQKMPKNRAAHNRMMSDFLQLEVLKTFEITLDQYRENRIKAAKEARWAVVHLLRSFTHLSHRRVGQLLLLSYRAARYAHDKCIELIEVGKFEKDFNARYAELEEKLVAFIAKI